ncbi:MAG: hypothetical protein RLZZ139_4048 [Cyanobacteriota bacterium]
MKCTPYSASLNDVLRLLRFYNEQGELAQSLLVPNFPNQIKREVSGNKETLTP